MASYGFHSPAPSVVKLMGEKTNLGPRKPTMNHPASQSRPFAALALILIHLVISMLHGTAHQGAMVALTAFGNVYVIVVITLAPLVAAALLFTRKQKLGALLLALSMFLSFIFGF